MAKRQKEDRINLLSDDVLVQILSKLDSRYAVRTCVLCKRWLYLWTNLPALNLSEEEDDILFKRHYFFGSSNFATGFLKYRNPRSLLSSIDIIHRDPDGYYYSMLRNPKNRKIFEYALTHNVEHLRISGVEFVPCTPVTSASIKTLHLTSCHDVNIMDWTMPNLTSLYLERVRFGDRILASHNLKELTLAGFFTGFNHAPDIFTIDGPNLESLILGPDLPNYRNFMFTVSAPKLLYFEFRSGHVPRFSAGDGFPCIKEVDIDIQIKDDAWKLYNKYRIKSMMQNFITMCNAIKGTPLLKLAEETIQVLRRIPDFSKYQPSPFGDLKFLSLRGLSENPAMASDHVINYLLKNSPSAAILQGNIGRIPKLQNKRRNF